MIPDVAGFFRVVVASLRRAWHRRQVAVPAWEYSERLSICRRCPSVFSRSGLLGCRRCGCLLSLKASLRESECPENRWR